MKYFIFLFFVFLSGSLPGQIDKLDSIINVSTRSYRTVLNDSDYEFVDNLIIGLTKDSCMNLYEILADKSFSAMVTVEVVRRMAEKDICLKEIIDNVGLMKYYETDELLDIRQFPIEYIVYKDSSIYNKVMNYLFESDYLDDCTLLFGIKYEKLSFLSWQIKKSEPLSEDKLVILERPCFVSNWILLRELTSNEIYKVSKP